MHGPAHCSALLMHREFTGVLSVCQRPCLCRWCWRDAVIADWCRQWWKFDATSASVILSWWYQGDYLPHVDELNGW